jgi:hypothetical protein
MVFASCNKSYNVVSPILPIEHYSFLMFDSIEGVTTTNHFPINRIIMFQYDPNFDKCYMKNPSPRVDTFDRSAFFVRAYINRTNSRHRIIFNADTVIIHYPGPGGTIDEGFRYTKGVKQ